MHGVRAIDRGMVRSSSPAGLGRALSGRRFASARRHGKLLVCPNDGPALLLRARGAAPWSGASRGRRAMTVVASGSS
jgi:hypothetical protein